MSRLRDLLQDADPLRHEAPRLDAERERIRTTILRGTPAPPAPPALTRLSIVATLAIAIVVAALGYAIWTHGSTPVLAAVRFEMRLAEDRPTPGLVVAQLPDSGRLIYLHPEIVVTNDDLAQSSVIGDGSGGFGVAVVFLPPGAERIRQATSGHIGRPVAMLIDGRVVMAPVVRSAIGESAVITGHFTQSEATRIADGIAPR